MDKQVVSSDKDNLIKCIQNYVTIDDNLKLINEKTKLLKEKKGKLSKAICSYVEENNINKNIKIINILFISSPLKLIDNN